MGLAAGSSVDPATGRGGARPGIAAGLELLALTGVVLVQPVLDLLAKNPSVFVLRRVTPAEFIGVTLIVTLGPALVLWAVELVVALVSRRAARLLHLGFIGGLVGLLVVEVGHRTTDAGRLPLLVIGLIGAGAGVLLVVRFDVVRRWLRVLSIAPIAFLVLFLVSSEAASAVFDRDAEVQAGAAKVHGRIIVVVMDQFPLNSLLDGSGRINEQLFPNFAELARTTTWYRNSTTVAPNTEQAVPALLTGRMPDDPDATPTVSNYPENLFTWLGRGVGMNVHEQATALCPDRVCTSVSSSGLHGVVDILDVASSLWRDFAFGDRSADSTAADLARPTLGDVDALGTANGYLQSLKARTGPELDFFHLMLPHHPWHYVATGQDYEALVPAPGIGPGFTWANRWSAAAARQRNLIQVQTADAVLGRLIRKLRRLHDYDATTLVVTADHGVAFEAGRSVRGVEAGNYDEIMWTPLFIKRPGQVRGAVDDDPATIVDVLPTIAEIQGTKVPFAVDGRSLLHPRPPVAERPIFRWATNPESPPPGSNYLDFDGPSGFAAVLREGVAGAPGDNLLAYRLGDHGDLVGRRVTDVAAASPDAAQVTLVDADSLGAVKPDAASVPWTFLHGVFTDRTLGRPIAVAVNGVVAGTTWTSVLSSPTTSDFWVMLAPQLFRPGANDVQVYAVVGTGPDERLAPIGRAP